MAQKIVIGVIGLVLLAAIAGYAFRDSIPFLDGLGNTPIGSARYLCDGDKTISATYYEGEVKLELSDFRSLTFPQLIAASGIRYGNEDESIVFWSKGETAFMTENGAETFSNCEEEVDGQAPRATYSSSAMGISIKYPRAFTLSDTYQYMGVPNKPISGVKVSIPESMATGTNLSLDSGVSVEQLPRALNCTGDIFLLADVRASDVTENGVPYSVASSSEAGAGNRYEEVVYALAGSKPCTAVRYFIHYAAIENFEPGFVEQFDRAALMAEFDKIRASLQVFATSSATTP